MRIYSQLLLIVTVFALLSGCATTGRIAAEREAFSTNPERGGYSFDGSFHGGEHWRYLCQNDASFGAYLISLVPDSNSAELVFSALLYYSTKCPDRVRFEQVVLLAKPGLLSRSVVTSGDECLVREVLSVWIQEQRKRFQANKSVEVTPTAVTPAAGAPGAPSAGAPHH
jgi:hypothetical protein